MIGLTFGRWTVLRFVGRVKSRQYWECLCECGTKRNVLRDSLRFGRSSSCGCLNREKAAIGMRKATTRHGHCVKRRRTPEYYTWRAMIVRCTYPRYHRWMDYGGRGIEVCERWMKFENFLADMGPRPVGKTLHRIDDAKVYSKETCKWATLSEQRLNRRDSVPQAA